MFDPNLSLLHGLSEIIKTELKLLRNITFCIWCVRSDGWTPDGNIKRYGPVNMPMFYLESMTISIVLCHIFYTRWWTVN